MKKINIAEDVFKVDKVIPPTGYKLIERLFCDNSGLGSPSEPALTASQTIEKVNNLLDKNGQLYGAILEAGQFQVYIGIYLKDKTAKDDNILSSKKIENNTWLIEYKDGSKAYRLHKTDVVIFKGDSFYLNTDGWKTVTTKDRINKYMPQGYYIQQKNYQWWLVMPDGSKLPYNDNIRIIYKGA